MEFISFLGDIRLKVRHASVVVITSLCDLAPPCQPSLVLAFLVDRLPGQEGQRMLNGQELAEIEHYMREEHRKDLEALERLKRFLPENDSAPADGPLSAPQPENVGGESVDASDDLADFMYQREI
jgi:hypothetical protein